MPKLGAISYLKGLLTGAGRFPNILLNKKLKLF